MVKKIALTLILAGIFWAFSAQTASANVNCYHYSDEIGYLCGTNAPPTTFVAPATPANSFLPTTSYGRLAKDTYIYNAPNGSVVRHEPYGYLMVTINGWETVDGKKWYMINPGEYVPETHMIRQEMSTYKGVEVLRQPERPFGWIVARGDVIPSREPFAEPDPLLGKMYRYDFVEIFDAVEDDEGWLWYDVGQGRWLRQTEVSIVDLSERPAEVGENEYWTEVDLYEQTFAAYEGDRMVFATLISSGLNRWPTWEGLFQVFDRHVKTKMSGAEGQVDYYFVQDVPHTMFFDELTEIALHGAYWHDRFGFKHSHGCVNMPPYASEWVYNWSAEAENDLWVLVHTSDPHHYFTRYQPEDNAEY
jgi:hypothetical protein